MSASTHRANTTLALSLAAAALLFSQVTYNALLAAAQPLVNLALAMARVPAIPTQHVDLPETVQLALMALGFVLLVAATITLAPRRPANPED